MPLNVDEALGDGDGVLDGFERGGLIERVLHTQEARDPDTSCRCTLRTRLQVCGGLRPACPWARTCRYGRRCSWPVSDFLESRHVSG